MPAASLTVFQVDTYLLGQRAHREVQVGTVRAVASAIRMRRQRVICLALLRDLDGVIVRPHYVDDRLGDRIKGYGDGCFSGRNHIRCVSAHHT